MLNRVTGILLLTAGAVLAQTSVDLPQHRFALMEAMQITLERHPAIQIELRQVDISRGALRVASGQFDTQIQYDLSQNRANSPLTQLQRGQYFRERSAEDCEVLREDVDESAVDAAVSGDYAVAVIVLLLEAEIV